MSKRAISILIFIFFAAGTISPAFSFYQRNKLISCGIGCGIGVGSMSVNYQSDNNFGLNICNRIGIGRFHILMEVNPLNVKNPVIDESFRAVNTLVSIEIGKELWCRPCIGRQFRFWSGSQKVVNKDNTFLYGLDIGYLIIKSNHFLAETELVLRFSPIEAEGNVQSQYFGLQMVFLVM